MSMPKYVKITKDGVEYIDGLDRAAYCLAELSRAAMVEVGKLITRRARLAFVQGLSKLFKHTGKGKRTIQYWVPRKNDDGSIADNATCYVGYKAKMAGFYAAYFENGDEYHDARRTLFKTVNDHIDEIRGIEAYYLSGVERDDDGAGLINEDESEGGEG